MWAKQALCHTLSTLSAYDQKEKCIQIWRAPARTTQPISSLRLLKSGLHWVRLNSQSSGSFVSQSQPPKVELLPTQNNLLSYSSYPPKVCPNTFPCLKVCRSRASCPSLPGLLHAPEVPRLGALMLPSPTRCHFYFSRAYLTHSKLWFCVL